MYRLNGSKVWAIVSLVTLIGILIFGNDSIQNVKIMIFCGIVYICSQFELSKAGTLTLTIKQPEEVEVKQLPDGKDVQV